MTTNRKTQTMNSLNTRLSKNIKTQNNLFVGSTKDLLKAIKNEKETIDVTPDDAS